MEELSLGWRTDLLLRRMADPDHPAIRLYRSIGFTDAAHQLRVHRDTPAC